MNYIVLVKQVPDIRNIPDEAWDWEKGTLKRGLLENVLNELDKQALVFTLKMREQHNGQVVALTMGPPFAEEVLRYALSVGADDAVLLTDRKLGGADTAATAYPLARAISKIEAELFHGDREYIIVSGMQSVDGDTAQVPPQIAEELGMVHIAYATSFNFDNGQLRVDRITRRGSETVAPDNYPCMVTVTQWTEPPFASFHRTRWAQSQEIYQWSADDVHSDESQIGLAGSRTAVVKIFSPKEISKKTCVFEDDVDKLVKMLRDNYDNKLESTEKDEQPRYHLPEGKKADYQGEIWVFAEQEGGEINAATFELLGKATELADQLNEKTAAVLVGHNIKDLPPKLISYGADRVYVVDDELLKDFLPLAYSRAVSKLIGEYAPQMMLFSATPLGRELAPRVAYRTKSGLTADCTGLEVIDTKRGRQEYTGVLQQTRPALGGNIMAAIITQNSTVQMSTARPGVMRALEPDDQRKGEIIEYLPRITRSDLGAQIISSTLRQMTSEIKDAGAIVCAGAGCKTKDNFEKYILPLADSLGRFLGQEAMVGASRAAVELGFTDRSHQIGQTGQTVKPRVYIAAGVSGAVQHLTGMQNSEIIIAINKDPKAPIFKVCDYGLVGNLEEIIPQLIAALDGRGD